MIKVKIVLLCLLVLVLSFNVLGQASNRVDSDGDTILDSHDNCLGTNSDEGLPIILRNPEFLGCSCSQIFKLVEDEYCLDVYCFPNRPLDIKPRTLSSRANPCPSPRCEGDNLYTYDVDKVYCNQGRELPYECSEVIVEDSQICIEGLLDTNSSLVDEEFVEQNSVFDVVVLSYFDESSAFVDVLDMKSKTELIENNNAVLKNVDVERVVSVNERIINNKPIMVADISLVVTPNSFSTVDNFVFVERIVGDLNDKNVVIYDEFFYDSNSQMIVWTLDSLSDEVVFKYRVTPGTNLDFEYFVQGDTSSTLFRSVILPLLLGVIIIGFVVFWIINMNDKNRVFKN